MGKSADTLAREYAVEAVGVMAEIMRDPLSETKDRLKAAEMLVERGHGKAAQAIIAIPASRRVSEAAAQMTDEELMDVMRATPLPQLMAPEPVEAEFEVTDDPLLR